MPEIKDIHMPKCYEDIETLREEYNKKKYVLVSFERFTDLVEAKKLKDFLLGMTYAKDGIAFQFGKTILFSQIKDVDLKDSLNLSSFTWRDN